jgi:soluble lytic murein transglycosylase-like protein
LPLLAAAQAGAWQQQARRICQGDMGIPFAIVQGIVQVESGGHPYVLGVGVGDVWRSYRFEQARSAKLFLREALMHTERIDIGLMQVHWATWKRHYHTDATALLDVATNLRVGCDILRRELAGDGPLWRRLGRYHSRTPARNQRYALKVLRASLSRSLSRSPAP